MIDSNECVKNLSAGIRKDEKQMDTEELPAMVDNKRQTTNVCVMQTIKEPTTTTNSAGQSMKSNGIGEENVLIFDPGGDLHNEQQVCMINLIKEIIIEKECEDDEGGNMRENCSKIRSSLEEVAENGNKKRNGDENSS